MTDQFLTEVFKQAPVVILLVGILVFGFRHFTREVATIRGERDLERERNVELSNYIRTDIVPTMTRMNDASLASAQMIMDARAELRERNRP